jgi:DNA-binding MarR family transcriptional regulator
LTSGIKLREDKVVKFASRGVNLLLVAPFSFLTNHGLALLCIAEDPESRMRDIAASVDITERAAQKIVADLVENGYVERTRVGRRNTYAVRRDRMIRTSARREVDLGSLLSVLVERAPEAPLAQGPSPSPATG